MTCPTVVYLEITHTRCLFHKPPSLLQPTLCSHLRCVMSAVLCCVVCAHVKGIIIYAMLCPYVLALHL